MADATYGEPWTCDAHPGAWHYRAGSYEAHWLYHVRSVCGACGRGEDRTYCEGELSQRVSVFFRNLDDAHNTWPGGNA